MATTNTLPFPQRLGVHRTRQSAPVAVVAAVVLLAAVVFVNEAVFRVADVEQFAFDWQVALRLLVCAGCGMYGLFHLPQTAQHLLRFPCNLSLLFGVWSLVTVPSAVNPGYAATASAALWCAIVFAPAVLLRLGPRLMLSTIVAALLAFLAASWTVYLAAPEIGCKEVVTADFEVMHRLGGLAHPNGLGRQAALTVTLLLVLGSERISRWRTLALPLGLASVTLICTDCRTALLAAVAGGAVVLLRKTNSTVIVLGFIVAVILTGLAMLGFSVGLLDGDAGAILAKCSRSGDVEEIYSLTGRTDLWSYAADKILQSPMVGYGYACSRFIMTRGGVFPTHHAHNLLLNVALGSGIVGGLLLVAMLTAGASAFFLRPSVFPDVVLALVLVGGVADYVMLGPIPDSHTVLWFVALLWRQVGASLNEHPADIPAAES